MKVKTNPNWHNMLAKIAKDKGMRIGTLAKGVKIKLFSAIVDDTRVDTGRLKGNWNIQEGSASLDVTDDVDKKGEAKKQEITDKATESGKTFFTNNLPYAEVYENEDGMVAENVRRFESILKKEARRLRLI